MKPDRNELKAYRCFGGFMLFVGAFANILTLVSTPAVILFTGIFSDPNLGSEVFTLVSSAAIIYTYYLGYRIFIKTNGVELLPEGRVSKQKVIGCVIISVLVLGTIRYIWYCHMELLNSVLGFSYEAERETGIVAIIYGVLVAPIAEEIVFRGWLLKMLRRYGDVAAVLFTSLAFGLMHGTLVQSAPAVFIGLLLGFIALKYRSIVPTILIHMATNAMSIADIAQTETRFMTVFMAMAAITAVFVAWMGRKKLFSAPDWKKACSLLLRSISFIVFIITSIGMIWVSYLALAALW